jgi:hypothetical protein
MSHPLGSVAPEWPPHETTHALGAIRQRVRTRYLPGLAAPRLVVTPFEPLQECLGRLRRKKLASIDGFNCVADVRFIIGWALARVRGGSQLRARRAIVETRSGARRRGVGPARDGG